MTKIAWSWQWQVFNAELLVSESVANTFNSYRQQSKNTERGGQLFVDIHSSVGLLLASATPPHKSDRSGFSWLELDEHRCQKEIKAANRQGLRLVGYWHTHPQTIPAISPADIKSFSDFAVRYSGDLPYPIAVIVGTSIQPNGIKAWSFRDGICVEATAVPKNDTLL